MENFIIIVVMFLWLISALPILQCLTERRDQLTLIEFVIAYIMVIIGAPILWFASCFKYFRGEDEE